MVIGIEANLPLPRWRPNENVQIPSTGDLCRYEETEK
jgi:hypothetical protein